ncbi:hypothetical protein [Vibrio alfacsensis]|uniref:hypothetical protein n=1 Tax=Vibrio alfacsensis TaxID=1074311 RepID=UPI0040683CC3
MEAIILMAVGALIGALISWGIAHRYHQKASIEFDDQISSLTEQINSLSELNKSLSKSVEELIAVSNFTAEKAEIIEEHALAGTSDDPNWPYK